MNKKKVMKKVICAFPGVVSMDKLMKADKGIITMSTDDFKGSGYPGNYIDAIKINLKEASVSTVIVSCDPSVREELAKAQIPYCNVYPYNNLRIHYLKKLRAAKAPKSVLNRINTFWFQDLEKLAKDKSEFCIMKMRLNSEIDLLDII